MSMFHWTIDALHIDELFAMKRFVLHNGRVQVEFYYQEVRVTIDNELIATLDRNLLCHEERWDDSTPACTWCGESQESDGSRIFANNLGHVTWDHRRAPPSDRRLRHARRVCLRTKQETDKRWRFITYASSFLSVMAPTRRPFGRKGAAILTALYHHNDEDLLLWKKMKNEFYVVLPSNSSMNFFNNNTTSHYVTQLSQTIRLVGDWCVALTEIHIPLTFQHISHNSRDGFVGIDDIKNNDKPDLQIIRIGNITENMVADSYNQPKWSPSQSFLYEEAKYKTLQLKTKKKMVDIKQAWQKKKEKDKWNQDKMFLNTHLLPEASGGVNNNDNYKKKKRRSCAYVSCSLTFVHDGRGDRRAVYQEFKK
ncbi:unnamed protein product [Trichogramma brassicae]|uniref:Uncharacterized protein n=1 Tax=Trichogramma brassicae TaxID=86971 RepID=A0A6H5IY21_9HYME|nr:unnamed protein product [Trichogramma brassicae]